jgi:DNA-binding NarL/FixJ family response regulator
MDPVDTSRRARLLLVDDSRSMLQSVVAVLGSEFDIVATLEDGRRVEQTVAERTPDVVVLDINLPGESGLAVTASLMRKPCPVRVVILTLYLDSDYVRVALGAGALGYVTKDRLATDLAPAVRAALAGTRFVSEGAGLDHVI